MRSGQSSRMFGLAMLWLESGDILKPEALKDCSIPLVPTQMLYEAFQMNLAKSFFRESSPVLVESLASMSKITSLINPPRFKVELDRTDIFGKNLYCQDVCACFYMGPCP